MKDNKTKRSKKDRTFDKITTDISADTSCCLNNGLCINCHGKLPPLNKAPKECLSCGFSLIGFDYEEIKD
jgi:hypothetical protein